MRGAMVWMLVALVCVGFFAMPVPMACAQGDETMGASEPFSMNAVIQDMKRKFKAGGLTMWFLAFLSILSLAFVLERLFRLSRRII